MAYVRSVVPEKVLICVCIANRKPRFVLWFEVNRCAPMRVNGLTAFHTNTQQTPTVVNTPIHIFSPDFIKINVLIMMTSSNGNIFRVTGHLCREFTGPGAFPTQRAVTRSFDVYFDLRPNKWLSKQSWGWWFETLSPPLWRHRNVTTKNTQMKSNARWRHQLLFLENKIFKTHLLINSK